MSGKCVASIPCQRCSVKKTEGVLSVRMTWRFLGYWTGCNPINNSQNGGVGFWPQAEEERC